MRRFSLKRGVFRRKPKATYNEGLESELFDQVLGLVESEDMQVGLGEDSYSKSQLEYFEEQMTECRKLLDTNVGEKELAEALLLMHSVLTATQSCSQVALKQIAKDIAELERLAKKAGSVGIDMQCYPWHSSRLDSLAARNGIIQRVMDKSKELDSRVKAQLLGMANKFLHLKSLITSRIRDPIEFGGPCSLMYVPVLNSFLYEPYTGPHKDKTCLDPEEVYHFVHSTKVLFSFASRDGGLKTAVGMKRALCNNLGLSTQEVYIDCENLLTHRCTHWETRDRTSMIPLHERPTIPLNPHWAEFYLFAAMMTYVVVLVVDDAWHESRWCQNENSLFMEHMLRSYFKGADPKHHYGSEFDMIIAYHKVTSHFTDGEVNHFTQDINDALEREMTSSMYDLGVPETKPIHFMDWYDYNSLYKYVEAGIARVQKECSPELSPDNYREAVCNVYAKHWQSLALESENLANHIHE